MLFNDPSALQALINYTSHPHFTHLGQGSLLILYSELGLSQTHPAFGSGVTGLEFHSWPRSLLLMGQTKTLDPKTQNFKECETQILLLRLASNFTDVKAETNR